MANKKISALDPVVTVTSADALPMVNSGDTKKVTIEQITEFVGDEIGIDDKITGVNTSKLTVSAVEPVAPAVNDLWIQTT